MTLSRDTLCAGFVARETGGEILRDGGAAARGVTVDTRQACKNGGREMFAAIRGEHTDGNLYIDQAVGAGCAGILFSGSAEIPENGDFFAVRCDDTVAALGRLAGAYLKRFDVPRVGVTGSVGKTTTRGMVSSVLSEKFRVHSTSGNFNNELGLPLTALNMPDNAEAGVFELGMGKKGDISYLSGIVRPDIGVITSIGTAHIEFLGSREAIRDAKLEITDGMGSGGKLVLNGDEPLLDCVPGALRCSVRDPSCDWYAGNIAYTAGGMTFDVFRDGRLRFENAFVPAFGEHIVMDALLAWAAGDLLSVPDDASARGIAGFSGIGQRQKIEKYGGTTLIIDCYNASAESVHASETVGRRLADENGGHFITVFGDVLELGRHSRDIHEKIGRFSAGLCDAFVTYGTEAAFAARAASEEGLSDVCSFGCDSLPAEVAGAVASRISAGRGDVVLFKASHGMDLGRIADAVRDIINRN